MATPEPARGEARDVIDEQEAATLPASDPNIASAIGDFDHLNFIADPDDEDDTADGQAR